LKQRIKRLALPALSILALAWGSYLLLDPGQQRPEESSKERVIVGLVESPKGRIFVRRAGGQFWKPAGQGTQLYVGDALRSGPNSGCVLTLVDGNLLQVSSGTLLVLEQVGGQGQSANRNSVQLQKGEVEAQFTAGRSQQMTLRTPHGALTIRPRKLVFPTLEARLPGSPAERAVATWKISRVILEVVARLPGEPPAALARGRLIYRKGRRALAEKRHAESIGLFEEAWIEFQTALREAQGKARVILASGAKGDRIEVLSGQAKVEGGSLTRQLTAGQGLLVGKNQPLERPRELPGTPTALRPRASSTLYNRSQVLFQWAGLQGATSYVLEIASRASFDPSSIQHNRRLAGTSLTLQLGDARYFWRVRARNKAGFAGPPTRPFAFRVLTDHDSPKVRLLGQPKWGEE